LSRIYNLSSDLDCIISDMLDITSIDYSSEAGSERAIIDLNSYLSEIVLFYKAQSSKHVFEFDLPEGEIKLNIDKGKFTLLMNNIIDNAFKYSPDGGTITVTGVLKDSELIMSVQDEGIGMTKDQIEKIYDEFYRVDFYNRKVKGSGLGMSIAKQIVNLYKGDIRVESEWKKGTKVVFRLPLSMAQAAA